MTIFKDFITQNESNRVIVDFNTQVKDFWNIYKKVGDKEFQKIAIVGIVRGADMPNISIIELVQLDLPENLTLSIFLENLREHHYYFYNRLGGSVFSVSKESIVPNKDGELEVFDFYFELIEN